MPGIDYEAHSVFHLFRLEHGWLRIPMQVGYYVGEWSGIGLLALFVGCFFFWPRVHQRFLFVPIGWAILLGTASEIVRWQIAKAPPNSAGEFATDWIPGSFPCRPVVLIVTTLCIYWRFLQHLQTPTWLLRCWYALGGLLIVWVMLAQLYFSLCWLSGILAGVLVGIAIGQLCFILPPHLDKKRTLLS